MLLCYRLIASFLLSICFQLLPTATADLPPTVWINGSQPLTGTLSPDGLVESYLGIPYAAPPLGPLRFSRPIPFTGSYANFSATEFGPSCPAALSGGTLAAFDDIAGIGKYLPPHMRDALHDARAQMTPMDENCLSLNVFCPAAKNPSPLKPLLPVMVWIHGGAFQFGGSSMYPGDPFVRDGIALNLPVIIVTFNYRLGALGFLGGSAVLKDQQSANAGLHDQRLALEWVSKHIEAFGGDPSRIVIFGESAGAQSVYMHTVSHHIQEQKPLFSAAIMQSGSIIPTGYVDDKGPEQLFWRLAENTGCDVTDGFAALECLRYNATLDAIIDFQRNLVRNEQSGIITAYLGWSPRSDRDQSGLLPAPVHELSMTPRAIPQITGNQQDEGTLFALVLNATTGKETEELFQSMFGRASTQQIHQALTLYPDNPFSGAPFDTGLRNAVTPQYKRLAAVLTDIIFQAGRRLALARVPVAAVPTYVYQSTALHNIIPVLGTFHANDLIWQWREDEDPSLRWPGRPGQGILKVPSKAAVAAATQAKVYRRYFIAFATHHDPNIGSGLPMWPRFSDLGRDMLGVGPSMVYVDRDTFRTEQIGFFAQNYAGFMM
ncbi:uncharacterized protein SAPINGB_P000626 [Magnusiomyces paraingens]|uniref:Carboxylic ester hydrolase n=1 Tax=Magnusiomyces paraingens TaxID=2606893 RepID=A0A5E8B751_9ASCO|nr:uncharacterized protein SAPINGB_P000626 [Saprochaete ingens]VVT45066.1 unnamed protein product [Saprochaete ingens]